jgi:hypothetical protein
MSGPIESNPVPFRKCKSCGISNVVLIATSDGDYTCETCNFDSESSRDTDELDLSAVFKLMDDKKE